MTLLNWASINSTVRRYISQEDVNGAQTIAAYEAMQEKYYSSTLYSHILRFLLPTRMTGICSSAR